MQVFSEVIACDSNPPVGINDPFPLSLDVPDPTCASFYDDVNIYCAIILSFTFTIPRTSIKYQTPFHNNNIKLLKCTRYRRISYWLSSKIIE